MLDSKQELISKLSTALHQLAELKTYVAALEAQLGKNRPDSESLELNKESFEEMNRFLQSTFNGLPYSTCVLDPDGMIVFANYQWRKFADKNASPSTTYYLGVNYLTICRSASGPMSEEAGFVAAGISAVIAGNQDEFYLEYPCHSPTEKRWFMLRVTPFMEPTPRRVVVAHINITERKQAEDDLRRSKSQYQLLADNMTDVIWILDTSSMRFTYVSPSVELLRGYTPDEVLLQPVDEVIAPDSLSMINSELPDRLRAFLAGDPRAISNIHENQQTCIDGSLIWTEVVTKLLKDDAGTIQILGVSRNIAERKQSEDRIRKLNRTLAVLSDVNQVIVRIHSLSALFDSICQIAVEKGGFRMAWIGIFDAAANKVEPVSHAGIVGSYLNKLNIVLDDQPRGRGPTAKVVRMGDHVICNDIARDPSMLVSKNDALGLNYRSMASFPLKIGDEICGAISLYSSELDFFDDDEVKLLDEMAADISFAMAFAEQEAHRQRAESNLKASEEIYRSLIESSDSSIALFDVNGTLLYGNRIAAEALRLASETIIGKNMNELFPPAIAKRQLEAIQAVIRTGKGTVVEAPNVVSGEERWYRTSVQPVRDADGRVSAALINATDITPFKQAEAELQKARDTLEQRVNERTAELLATTERVEAILNNSTDAILLVSTDLTIRQANDSFSVLFRCVKDEYFNQSLLSLVHQDDSDKVTRLVQEALVKEQSHNFEIRAVRKDGTVFEAEMSIGHVKGDGLVCTLRDITVRKAQERQLRFDASVQKNLNESVISTDLQFVIQSWNHAAESIYGWSASEAIGKTIDSLLNAQLGSNGERQRLRQYFLDVGYWSGDVEQIRKDGSRVQVRGSVTRLDNDNNIPYGFTSVFRDVTELNIQERQLRYQASLQQNVSDAVIVTDLEAHIQSWNQAAERIYGWRSEETLGKTIADVLHTQVSPDEREGNMQQLRQQGWWQNEVIQYHKDGSLRYVLSSATLIKDQNGIPFSIVAINHDITERKQIEEDLRESEAKYRSLIETMRGGLVIFDPNRIITFINERFSELLGYSVNEVIGANVTDFIDPTNIPMLQSQMEARRRLESSTYELLFRRKDGSRLPMLVSGSPLLDRNGNYRGSFAVTTDITDRKQAEEALQSALAKEKELGELKSRFVSMASHEFRTPLATILAVTETLTVYRNKLTHVQIDERLDKIRTQVSYLKAIMEDVLLLARMQARHADFNPVRLDLNMLCHSVLEEYQSRPDITHNLIYTCNTPPPQVLLDQKLMRQIVGNLVSNAIKYSPATKPIKISLEFTDGSLILSVSDEGIGIPEADLPHLFEPFHRASNVGTISGTGLGLVITRESVELHGGVISVESQIDVGTTFTIRIPVSMML